jgi:crotonobetainyl-CoA:carnitine CoA-transferase CaiB-like acyl-CoA transferase
VAGPFATKLLADFGADVLKIEAPEGDPARRTEPMLGDASDGEHSALFLHLNTSKRSVTLDVTSLEGAAEIARLAADADVVIEDFEPGRAEAWGWGWGTLTEGRADLVMASISPYGQTGPYRDYLGSELTLQAIGGPMIQTGHLDREPVKLAGQVAHYHAGVAASLAILLARRRVEAGGPGDYIDLAVYECQAGFRDRRTIALTAAAYTGRDSGRPGTGFAVGSGVRPCADGYINLLGMLNREQFLDMIGRPELLQHPEIDAPRNAFPQALADEIETSYLEWSLSHTASEILHEAQGRRILCGAVFSIGDLVADSQYRDRGFWETVDHPSTGPAEYAGSPFRMSASPRPTARRAPLLGEHNDDRDWQPREDLPTTAGSATTPPLRPLEGVRVADITVVWAGPHVTQLLGEWGAEVIRVEPVNRIQPVTRGAESIVTRTVGQAIAGQPGQNLLTVYPDFDPGHDPWNRNASFNSHARNKLSMTADIMSPEGREAFLRLIEECDVFVENNVPETIEKAGIGWEELRRVNPRLIMVRMPGYGLTGPYKNFRAFGTHVESMVGFHALRGYPDATPDYAGNALTPDGIAGVMGAVAVMMGLRHRDRTGEGQLIEMPLVEAFLPVIGEYILDYTVNGHAAGPQGNTHPTHVPHNVYPCTGEDRWIAIDVETDEEFAALARVLERSDLAADARYATVQARREHSAELDAALRALTQNRDAELLFHALQAAGVCAAPTHSATQALADPQLNDRGFFRELTVPGVGSHRYPGMVFKLANTPDDIRLPPPLLGEHNEAIYLDLLGYSREEYDSLVERGLVGTRYPDHLLPVLGQRN